MSKRFWNELNDGGVDVHMSQTLPSFAGTRKKVKKVTISKKSFGGKSRGVWHRLLSRCLHQVQKRRQSVELRLLLLVVAILLPTLTFM